VGGGKTEGKRYWGGGKNMTGEARLRQGGSCVMSKRGLLIIAMVLEGGSYGD